MQVSVHETPAPSKGIELSPNHLELLSPDLYPKDGSIRGDFWKHWFACAAIAVYGYPNRTLFYRFLPNQQFLHNAQIYDIDVESAFHSDFVDLLQEACDKRLEYVDDSNIDPVDASDEPGALQALQHADGRHRIWLNRKDLQNLGWLVNQRHRHNLEKRYLNNLLALDFQKNQLGPVFEKHIAMRNLLRLCLHWLISNPIQLESLSIGSLPEEPWDLDKLAQHTSDLILREIILDVNFAQKTKSQIDNSMSAQARPLNLSNPTLPEHERRRVDIAQLVDRSSPEVSAHFCCAIVLLAIIGQRAAYLLSGLDVTHCENEWPDVYLS